MNKALLFGLDGTTYTILDDLVWRGVKPYLGQFLSEATPRDCSPRGTFVRRQ